MLGSFTGSFAAGFRKVLSGALPSIYWYTLYGDLQANTNIDYSSSIAYDSLGNIYILGTADNSGDYTNVLSFVVKFNTYGELVWQKSLTDTSGYKNAASINVDSNNNVYVVINIDDVEKAVIVVKLSTVGDILWQHKLAVEGASQFFSIDSAVDSLNNLYVSISSTIDYMSIKLVKYDSDGNLIDNVWPLSLVSNFPEYLNSRAEAIATDIDNNVIVAFTSNISQTGDDNSGDNNLIVVKIDQDANVLWQKLITFSGNAVENGYGITTDSEGSVYIVGDNNSDVVLSKITSDGTFVDQEGSWPRFINLNNNITAYAASVDSNDNIIIAGVIFNNPSNDLVVFKYSKNGALQWQRTFSSSNTDSQYYYWGHRMVDVRDEKYSLTAFTRTGDTDITTQILTAQLPIDGSLIGTYGSFTYAQTSFVDSDAALTGYSITIGVESDIEIISTEASMTVSDNTNNGYSSQKTDIV